jgi:carbon-monoxide dehydrogenase medium subunit
VKPSPFVYHRAQTPDEAVALLAEHGDEAKILAGGQSLVPMLNLRLAAPGHLVDISRVSRLASSGHTNGSIEIGAGVRQAAVEDDPVLMAACPLLAVALPHVAHREIRNSGTVCGSIAHGDAAAEIPVVALALEAEMIVLGPGGERNVPAADFFRSYLQTALGSDELLVAVRFPAAQPGTGASFHELARRAGDYAIAGAGASVTVRDGVVESARIGCLGVDTVPVRAIAGERALEGQVPAPEAIAAAANAAASELDPHNDLHASAALRRSAAETLMRRAISDAVARAGNGPDERELG